MRVLYAIQHNQRLCASSYEDALNAILECIEMLK